VAGDTFQWSEDLIPCRKFLYEARRHKEEMNTSKGYGQTAQKTHKNPADRGQEDKVLDANHPNSIVGTDAAIRNQTEVFLCFFLNCKANARVKPAKTGHGSHSS
jgi:hypothetical protein